ncbi:MAG: hypothetical protein WBQ94_18670, partial [Terracidiphilus sp.]
IHHYAVHQNAARQIGSHQPDDSGVGYAFPQAVDQDIVIDPVEGSHYTLPIISTFPRELQLSALGIRLKVNL